MALNMSNNDSGIGTVTTDNEVYPIYQRIIEGTILSIISFLALFGNLSLWIIVCKNRQLRTITNVFILSLSAADLFVAVFPMPLTVVTIFAGSWLFSDSACTVTGYFNMLALVTSVMSLCNISINRYMMVCMPMRFMDIYTNRNAGLMITAVVTVSALLSIPPLFGWGKYSYIHIQSFCFCDWTYHDSYAIFMIVCCFGGPLSVMTVCNIFIFRSVQQSRRRIKLRTKVNRNIKNSTNNTTGSSPVPSVTLTSVRPLSVEEKTTFTNLLSVSNSNNYLKVPDEPSCNSTNIKSDGETILGSSSDSEMSPERRKLRISQKNKQAEEIRLAFSLAIVVVVFVLCWLPYCISMMLNVYYKGYVPRGFHMFTILIGYFNSCCNPVIYGVMNQKFGTAFKELYCNCFRRKENHK